MAIIRPVFIYVSILRIFAASIILIVTLKCVKVERNKFSNKKGNRLLTIAFIYSSIGTWASVITGMLSIFLESIPEILLKFLTIIYYVCQMMAIIYSIHYTSEEFYKKNNRLTIALYDILAGLMFGMLLAAITSEKSWDQHGHPPAVVSNTLVFAVLAISITILRYSFVSAKNEKNLLNKMGMKTYGYGILIFVAAMFLIAIITEYYHSVSVTLPMDDPISILITNSTYFFNPLNTYMMYVGCFKPLWFQKRYRDTWIALKLRDLGVTEN